MPDNRGGTGNHHYPTMLRCAAGGELHREPGENSITRRQYLVPRRQHEDLPLICEQAGRRVDLVQEPRQSLVAGYLSLTKSARLTGHSSFDL